MRDPGQERSKQTNQVSQQGEECLGWLVRCREKGFNCYQGRLWSVLSRSVRRELTSESVIVLMQKSVVYVGFLNELEIFVVSEM